MGPREVCPTSCDLGEEAKIVAPPNQTDLLPYLPFQAEGGCENARRIHPEIEILELSCRTGAGLDG